MGIFQSLCKTIGRKASEDDTETEARVQNKDSHSHFVKVQSVELPHQRYEADTTMDRGCAICMQMRLINKKHIIFSSQILCVDATG